MDNSLYVISAIGQDKPGLVFSITNSIAELNINIVDVEAKAVRGYFLMFLVVDISTSDCGYEKMQKTLKPLEELFDLGIHVKPYEAGRRKADKTLMRLTVMGADGPGIVAKLTRIFTEHKVNVEKIKMIARGDYIAIEILTDISDTSEIPMLRKTLYQFSENTGLDVSLSDNSSFKKEKKVVIFDCDSTIIKEEIIDELAKAAGADKDVKEITDRAMNGELDFKEALLERVKLLKGLSEAQLITLTKSVHLTPGADELISSLHSMGYKVGVISGGFSFFTNYLKEALNLDYVFANELEIKDGVTTGKINGEIIDAERKGEIVKEIAKMENISTDQIVAVGDGANDRFMLKNVGLGIAFCPKSILKEYSHGMITKENISGLRYFMGIPDNTLE
ncbi:MAG: phosphoserine phosphatase SerB [Deltaproteobacteria bacterium]|nr:phosphoserine phosphatase SerB [Deltaproteobacteria bacterium]